MHLKVTAYTLPGICLHPRQVSQFCSLPLLHSLPPTQDVCRDVCKASFAHAAPSEEPTCSLAHSPPFTRHPLTHPRELAQSHTQAVTHHTSASSHPQPPPHPHSHSDLLVLHHFQTPPRVGLPPPTLRHLFTWGSGCLHRFLDSVRDWGRCFY